MIALSLALALTGALSFGIGVRYRVVLGLWLGAAYLGIGFLGVLLVLGGAE